jgi:stage II sporulation protein D
VRRKFEIASRRGFRILDPDTGRPVWKNEYREPILITTHGAPPSEARIWRVQVASLESREKAQELAERLGGATNEETSVAFSPDRGSWRVRVGRAVSREQLIPILQRIRLLGYADAWASDEPAPGGSAWLRLVDSDYATVALDLRRVVVEGTGLLAVNRKRYRGRIEAIVDASAGIRIVNALPLEEYLRGVVPAELGPELWPEIEALKAQAIAARTYAVRNLGRFAEEGFDLCDVPRCQVYVGYDGEHERSDEAIRATSGMIVSYGGEPINALYTSTCGGHTEDGGEIFPEEAAPYLRGVPCYPEEETLRRQGTVVEGVAASDAGGPPEELHAAALLAAAGIVSPKQFPQSWRRKSLREDEARALIDRTGERLGLAGRIAERRAAAERLGFCLALSDRIWQGGRAEALVDSRDLPALLSFTDAEAIPEADRPAAAALAGAGLLPAARDGALWPEGLLQRGEALVILQRAAALYGLPELRDGTVIRGGGRRFKLKGKRDEVVLAPPGRLALFLDAGRGPVAHQRLALYPGDRIRATRTAAGATQYLLVLPGRKGLSDDRYSPTYAWNVRMSARELKEKISERFDVGEVLDIKPVRRGVSGRVVSLRVRGTAGEATITGFNVRVALGLKESLFALERQFDPDGRVRQVVFAGKGWGHGVGMCQVGAFGMAARGSRYDGILRHYYTGIELTKLY